MLGKQAHVIAQPESGAFWYRARVVTIGTFIRITQDTLGDEPLVAGMVAKVVADVYGEANPGTEALVVVAGARKPCAVPLEAVEEITESDYGEDLPATRDLWRQRKAVWRERHGSAARRPPRPPPDEEQASSDPQMQVSELLRRSEEVDPDALRLIAGAALVQILSDSSVGALDMLADQLPSFQRISYARARKIRSSHVERWLWEGVRLYLAVRSFHPALGPVSAEPARERVRYLFERLDEGDAADRLSRFCRDVKAVKEALSWLAAYAMELALEDFAKGLKKDDKAYTSLGDYILQMHIVGFHAAFCSDSANHPQMN